MNENTLIFIYYDHVLHFNVYISCSLSYITRSNLDPSYRTDYNNIYIRKKYYIQAWITKRAIHVLDACVTYQLYNTVHDIQPEI